MALNGILMDPGAAVLVLTSPTTFVSGPGFRDFDADWIQLAIVVRESSPEAFVWVLDDAICKKLLHSMHETFKERVEDLWQDKLQHTKDLLTYPDLIPTVFPTSGFGKCADCLEMRPCSNLLIASLKRSSNVATTRLLP